MLGLVLLACSGCGDDSEPSSPMGPPSPDPVDDAEGLAMCCELGAICHPDASEPLNSPKQMCHSLGHENDPVKCRAQYESCLEACGSEAMEKPHACR